ncbi:enhanced serine sensitivity protein SseB C-terminal domain-containing protein [Streptacidiphilus sp. P02-A3a]|uniref:enhanced serine sensitivity protein SseB C-terminal domain-containing protein n=1 Tax=Streptacidiphilus sp. P02-A3a TaxID=2704468 RepID=UPI0015FC0766|nr:enhanced serine sensitivity protein SseB C-terminal domain-containing protein [Streptacidiphilus sp. P02-A3a]QMU72424.1 enhanced serine sensitivity protein SseB [Streptacidiphilus sp. P02-A3a]
MQHPGIPAQNATGGWPANELEQVLTAALGDPGATPRVVEVLRRSHVWLPLPGGPTRDGATLDLPTTELAGQPFVPVFSSEEQFRLIAGNLPFAVAPVHELAEGMPLGVGIVINPEGAVGIPIPAAGVPELRGTDPSGGGNRAPGGSRLGLRVPGAHEDPVEFLVAAIGELAVTPVVLTARRALVQVESDQEKLFVGVELARAEPEDQQAATLALGRALGAVPLPWEVGIVLLDLADDPLVDWMRTCVQPFFARG